MVWDNGIQVAFCARLRIGIMGLRGVAEGAHREVRHRAVEDSRGHPFIYYGQGSIQRPCLRDRLQFFCATPTYLPGIAGEEERWNVEQDVGGVAVGGGPRWGRPRQLPSVLENSASPKPTVASVQKMLLGSLKKELFAVKADDGDGWVTAQGDG